MRAQKNCRRVSAAGAPAHFSNHHSTLRCPAACASDLEMAIVVRPDCQGVLSTKAERPTPAFKPHNRTARRRAAIGSSSQPRSRFRPSITARFVAVSFTARFHQPAAWAEVRFQRHSPPPG